MSTYRGIEKISKYQVRCWRCTWSEIVYESKSFNNFKKIIEHIKKYGWTFEPGKNRGWLCPSCAAPLFKEEKI